MTAEEIIAQAKELPVISETARKLTVQLNQPDLHRSELVKTLRCDNVLTAKLLRVCNSADLGAREPIVSIDQALLLLGDDAIFRIVCAIGFGGSLGASAPGYATEANGLWNHSLSAGLGAEYIAANESYGGFLPSAAFTAGLLHDIGKIVLNKYMTPKNRADIRAKMAEESISRTDAEKAILGADHSEVGACLLKRWALPEPIVEAVANHHKPVTKPVIKMSALVYLANNAEHLSVATSGWETHAAQVFKTASEVLGLEIKEVENMVAGIQTAMQKLPQLQAAA
jgi:putative nucleotidyltransferase with HDIG domain